MRRSLAGHLRRSRAREAPVRPARGRPTRGRPRSASRKRAGAARAALPGRPRGHVGEGRAVHSGRQDQRPAPPRCPPRPAGGRTARPPGRPQHPSSGTRRPPRTPRSPGWADETAHFPRRYATVERQRQWNDRQTRQRTPTGLSASGPAAAVATVAHRSTPKEQPGTRTQKRHRSVGGAAVPHDSVAGARTGCVEPRPLRQALHGPLRRPASYRIFMAPRQGIRPCLLHHGESPREPGRCSPSTRWQSRGVGRSPSSSRRRCV